MYPEADMLPKESGFNQIRNGLLLMRAQIVTFSQDFFHHGDTICHPKSSCVTTKLNGMSTSGCNNNAIFSDKTILNWPRQSTGGACQSIDTVPPNAGRLTPMGRIGV